MVADQAQQIPDTSITIEEEEEAYGRFRAEPLFNGWGMTLGNSMRRTLLNALSGVAITSVKIDGVLHEFSTIPNVREEVNELMLNIKGIRLRSNVDREGRLRIETEGQGVIKAGDLMASADFEVVNPEHYLATLDSNDAKLSVELKVEHGIGYRVARHDRNQIIGDMSLDALFTPVTKANFKVEPKRIGERADLESLVVEVWTDGSISPSDAFQKAATMLSEKFHLFSTFGKETTSTERSVASTVAPDIYNKRIDSLSLSARTFNSLRRANIERVGQILEIPDDKLLQLRNFGQKSLTELTAKLVEIGAIPDPDKDKEEDAP